MNKIDFFNEFKELCEYYNSDIFKNKRITALYYDKVKNKNIDEFKKMCNEIINTSKYMPKIADFGGSYISELQKYIHKKREYSEEYLESFYDIGG